MVVEISRRGFIVGLALASNALGFTLSWAAEGSEPRRFGLGLRVLFDGDGTLTVYTGKAEMGQGVHSGFAQIVADEIGADWARVRAEAGPIHADFRPPGVSEQITGGSMSIRLQYQALRLAGAAAREMLVAEASSRWNVESRECEARDHKVHHRSSGRSFDFAELALGASQRPVPVEPIPRLDSDLTLTGKSVMRVDLPAKLDGSAVFGIDVRLPDQLFASIRHAPVKGSQVQAFDSESVAQLKGVVGVVNLGDAVSVVAETWWQAESAIRAMDIVWSATENDKVTSQEIRAGLVAALDRQKLPVAIERGDWASIPSLQTRSLTMLCEAPLLPHATMEPMSCTAFVQGGKCTVWAPTQGQDVARRVAAEAAGLTEDSVTIHTTLMGGAFGRRYEWDFVTQSVKISQALQRPVTLIWPREEDIGHDFFRPPSAARLSGVIGPDGRMLRLDAIVASPSANLHAWPSAVVDGLDKGALDGILDQPYEIGEMRVRYALTPVHVNVGFWRGVSYSINIPFIENFMDEAAAIAGIDPVQFRLNHLTADPRGSATLSRCAELARSFAQTYDDAEIGFAFGRPMMTPTAVAVVARPSETGFAVERIFAVVDCGLVINPDTVKAQAEGGALFGYLAAMHHRIDIDAGRVRQSNFHDVRLMTLQEAPSVTVEIMSSLEAPTGIGEPTTPVTMAALMNAVSQLQGRRISRLPVIG